MEAPMDPDFFSHITPREIEASGYHARLPFCIHEMMMISASFPVPGGKIREVLPSKKLVPVPIGIDDTTVITFSALDYREIDGMRPYQECRLMIPITHQAENRADEKPGFYLLYSAVTEEQAGKIGGKVFGFPENIASISFEYVDNDIRCIAHDERGRIMSLEVERITPAPQNLDISLYTVKNHSLCRTLIQTRGFIGVSDTKGGGRVSLGDHPVSQVLKPLVIHPTSVLSVCAPLLQGVVNPPEEEYPL